MCFHPIRIPAENRSARGITEYIFYLESSEKAIPDNVIMVKKSPERCPNIFEKFEVVKQNSILLIIGIHDMEK